VHPESTTTGKRRIQNDSETDCIVPTRLTHPLGRLHDPHFVIREIGSIHGKCVHIPSRSATKWDVLAPHSKGNYFRFTNPCKRPSTRSSILRVNRISQILQAEIPEPEVSSRSPQDRQGSAGTDLRSHLSVHIPLGHKLSVVAHSLRPRSIPHSPVESGMQVAVRIRE
jgi:hypothetical protein